MQVLGAVIQDLQNRLIGPLNDLKTPKPNPHSDCYLYEAKIPPKSLDQIKESNQITARLFTQS